MRWCERLTGFRRNVTERTRDFRAARIAVSKSVSGFDVELPRSLKAERRGDVTAALGLERARQFNVEAANGFAHGDPRSSKVSRAFGDISPKTGQALTPPHRRRAGPRASRARRSRAPESG